MKVNWWRVVTTIVLMLLGAVVSYLFDSMMDAKREQAKADLRMTGIERQIYDAHQDIHRTRMIQTWVLEQFEAQGKKYRGSR